MSNPSEPQRYIQRESHGLGPPLDGVEWIKYEDFLAYKEQQAEHQRSLVGPIHPHGSKHIDNSKPFDIAWQEVNGEVVLTFIPGDRFMFASDANSGCLQLTDQELKLLIDIVCDSVDIMFSHDPILIVKKLQAHRERRKA